MKKEQEYIQDITEIRSMMERSTRFLSLSGLSGILAGIYALVGAYVAHKFFYLNNGTVAYHTMNSRGLSGEILNLVLLALVILIFAIGTAIFLSHKKSRKSGERLWNSATRRLIINMSIPLVTGGVFILVLVSKGLFVLTAPATLIFYGLALINASKFTYEEVKSLGIIEIILGLIASYFTGYGLVLWALGFGIMHIAYGIYMHLKYEK